jgi:hypothetical protein
MTLPYAATSSATTRVILCLALLPPSVPVLPDEVLLPIILQ